MLNKSANQNQTFTVESLPGRPYATSHRSPPPIRRPPASKRSRSRKRKKAKSYILYYIIIILFCLAISFVFCYAVFFKVEKIKVVGNEVYSSKEIIDLVEVKVGDSLFQVSASSGESRLKTKLPYVREARIVRSLPATLQIQIVEEEPIGAIYSDTGFTILSATGKILQRGVFTPPEGVPTVIGLTGMEEYEIGTYAKDYTTESKPKDAPLLARVILLQQFHEELKQYDLYDKIDYIDVTDRYNIKAAYDNRILISFGTQISFKQKVQLFQSALEEEDKKSEGAFEGSINVSQGDRAHTRPVKADKLLDSRGYVVFEPLGGSEENTMEVDIPLEDSVSDRIAEDTTDVPNTKEQAGNAGTSPEEAANGISQNSTQKQDELSDQADKPSDSAVTLYDSPPVPEDETEISGQALEDGLEDKIEPDIEGSESNDSYMITLG